MTVPTDNHASARQTAHFVRWIIVAIATCLSSESPADDRVSSLEVRPRILHATSVLENAPNGTLVESLQNRFPELKGFELAPERISLPFRVSDDGEITVVTSDRLNFEKRNLWVLTIKARAPRVSDPYLEDFLQSLAEASDGQEFPNAESLRLDHVILSVRVHVVDQFETPRLADQVIEVTSAVDPQHLARIAPIESDRDDQLTYSIRCSTTDQLQVNPVTGVVSWLDPAKPDWRFGRHFVDVEVRDQQGNVAHSIAEFKLAPKSPAVTKTTNETISLDSQGVSGVESSAAPLNAPDPQANANGETRPIDPSAGSERIAKAENEAARTTQRLHHIRSQFLAENERAKILSDAIRQHDVIANTMQLNLQHHSEKIVDTTDRVISQNRPALEGSERATRSGSDASLDDAARTINAAAGSHVALNERETEERTVTPQAGPTSISQESSGLQRRSKLNTNEDTAGRRTPQMSIVVIALMSISVIVFLMYRRARNIRMEMTQRATVDPEVRLEQIVNNGKPESESVETDSEGKPSADDAGRKVPTIINRDDRDEDPDAPFDPESLVDEILLAASVPPSAGPKHDGDDTESSQAATCVPTSEVIVADVPPTQSPFVLLNESFLVEELLAPARRTNDDALYASLRSQLDVINTQFEQRNAEGMASESTLTPVEFESASSTVDEAHPPSELSVDSSHDTDLNSAAHASIDSFEPAYELHWDAEIQRYVKVEKRPEQETSDDSGSTFESHQTNADVVTNSSHRHEQYGSLVEDPDARGSAVCCDDSPESHGDEKPTERVLSLRAELADLFNLHATTQLRSQHNESESVSDQIGSVSDSTDVEKSPEESHLDSVARYLSQLLERSRKEEDADIFVERRGSSAGKWDGIDRRQKPKPVKSYIESYLEQHGGTLRDDILELEQRAQTSPLQTEETPRAPREHKPVDVNRLRQNMESFRAVAERSVETAMAAYRVRQAKGRLVGRSMLITGLIVVVGLGIGTNVFRTFHLEPLNWLMCAFILLCVAEFFLRVESIRKHRREMRLKILSAQKSPHRQETMKATDQPEDLTQTTVETTSVP